MFGMNTPWSSSKCVVVIKKNRAFKSEVCMQAFFSTCVNNQLPIVFKY